MDGLSRTAAGDVRGVEDDGLWVFRGIPYARDPSGSLRWRSPQPVAAWSGVRNADQFGPIAPQPPPVPGMSIRSDPTEQSEDCLSLNLWTPAIDDGRRPVLVWIHGGGFTSGTGASMLYHGDRLARMGDVVVVTINYRLGALGFLANSALKEQDGGWGNWGLRDQIAALEWVQQNISEFGGDPGNVTVFGESAGAMSISDLLASPLSTGLFHGAIIQSGPPACGSDVWATRRSAEFAALLDPSTDDDLFDLRTLSACTPGDLVAATQRVKPDVGGLPLPFLPVVDGGVLDRPPADAIRQGTGQKVPVMIGTNRDECTFFALADAGAARLDKAGLLRRLSILAGSDVAGPIIESYKKARSGRGEAVDPLALWIAITTDLVFRVPSLAFGEALSDAGADVFVYMFTWTSPFLGGILGSAHALEVPFVFGSVREKLVQPYSGSGPAAEALSDSMMRSWIAFASRKNPSCDDLGEWSVYDTASRPTMVLGERSGLEHDPRGEERQSWDSTTVDMANRLYHP